MKIAVHICAVACCVLMATPVQAANNTDLLNLLTQIQKKLEQLQTVTPAGSVAGATSVTVSNDQELFNALVAVTGGETIKLQPGTYSRVVFRGAPYPQIHVGSLRNSGSPTFSSAVTITSADPDNRAVVKAIELRDTGKWIIDGLSFRPDPKTTAISAQGPNITIRNNDFSSGDSKNWTASDWNDKAGNGIEARSADKVRIENNYFENIGYGISILHSASNAYVGHNVIDTFNGDGIRGLSDNAIYEHNIVQNPIASNANHDDAFQSWRDYGNNNRPVYNATVRHNTFINSTKDHPLRGQMQGVGMFDGPFIGWTIENNLIVVDHWHGISLYGAKDSVIKNNVVLDPNNTTPGPSWVKFFNHKDGTLPENNKMLNNYGNSVQATSAGVESSGNTNVAYADYGQYFVDHLNKNFKLKQNAVPFAVGADANIDNDTVNAADKNQTPEKPKTTDTPVKETPKSPEETPVKETTPEQATTTQPTVTDSNFNFQVTGLANDKVISNRKLSVAVTVTDAEEIQYVRFYIDNKRIYNESSAPYQLTDYNLKNLSIGEHTFKIVIKADRRREVKTISFTVSDNVKTTNNDDIKTTPNSEVKKRVRTTDNLNVRSTPGGALIRIVARGAVGTLLDEQKITKGNHKWVKVSFDNGTLGYVSNSYITEESVNITSNVNNPTKLYSQMTHTEIMELIKLLIQRIQQLRNN